MNNSSNSSSNNVQTGIDEHHGSLSPSGTNTGTEIGIQRLTNSTVINMDADGAVGGGGTNTGLPSSARSVQRNFLSLFNEARSQLGRQASYPGPSSSTERGEFYFNNVGGAGGDSVGSAPPINSSIEERRMFDASSNIGSGTSSSPSIAHGRNIRSWRTNLNNVLSFSSAPSTEALRSFITHSGNFRYTPLNTNENASNADDIHILLNQRASSFVLDNNSSTTGLRLNSLRASRSNSMRDEGANNTTSASLLPQQQHNSNVALASSGGGGTSASLMIPQESPSSSSTNRQNLNIASTASYSQQRSVTGNNRGANVAAAPPPAGQGDIDEDNNVISDIFVKVLSHFVRYLPFICILFVKFIHDYLLGILDLLLLHSIMYQVNKSLREQIAKFSQKSYGALLRDVSLVALVVAYRIVLASSTPDPFGLLITPAIGSVTIEVTTNSMNQLTPNPQPSSATAASTASPDALGNTVTITKAISLGVLLYYVAVNDLILKLITILVKISITMMPTKMIRHKPRARMYVLVEYLSQFYRALVPVRQWLIFLFKSYSGLDVISGILFSSFYMGAKGFEFVERGKSLRKALNNFVRNMDYERKPTKDELDAAGSLCPICHDTFSAPVVLECGHIFCDDCVSTWFKREQTCPMCRAKVSEDPTWQDGSTTFFYQLC